MARVAILAERLSKRYRIGAGKSKNDRLTEALTSGIRGLLRRDGGADQADFWALRDVSFEVPWGAAVGVIGRNGAGKSTLLKVLARITSPTTGQAAMFGRVASLLEVGTGFHGDLTGRENIYFSGALLGMRRAEIDRKFDEIVDFSGVEHFIDTPVKHYSSGMAVRLGFAVAAHLEPEILLIDEVLAVGDADFQAKCLGKMEQIGGEGRAVVFVSHSMPSVLRLCPQAALLDHGRLVAIGESRQVVSNYLNSGQSSTRQRVWSSDEAPGDDVARLLSVRLKAAGDSEEVDIREPIELEVEYQTTEPLGLRPTVNINLFDENGVCLFVSCDWNDRAWWVKERKPGRVKSTCQIPGNFLAEGRHYAEAVVSTHNPLRVHAREADAVSFLIVDRSEGDGVRGPYAGEWPGVVRPMLKWRVEPVNQPGDWLGKDE